MGDLGAKSFWAGRARFTALVVALIFLAMLPLGRAPGQIPGPDLILVAMVLWTIRRPDLVPVGLIATLALITDLALMRPPGLMAALIVLGTEFLRARAHFLSDAPFAVEWATAAGVLTAISLANVVMLKIFAVPTPGLGLYLIALIGSVLAYPLVMAAVRVMFGLTRQPYVDPTVLR